MTEVTLAELCTAVAGVFEPDVPHVRNFNELPEVIADLPMIEWTPSEEPSVSKGSETQQFTFGGGVIREDIILLGNLYAHQRSHLGRDNQILIELLDKIRARLKTQTQPYFGHSAIKSYRWSWKRVIHKLGEQDKILGAQILLYLEVF